MNLTDALKIEGENIRASAGYRWLVWDRTEWVVYERKAHQHRNRVIARTKNEDRAVRALINEER